MNARVVDQEDRDLEMMTTTNKMRRREEDERRAAMLYRRRQLKRVFFTCARTAPGLVFLGAIPRDWMDPGFAVVCALCCFITAVCYYRRGYAHGE